MKRWIATPLSALLLCGCAGPQPAPPPSVPSVTVHNTKITTVESGGTTRTEEYARDSHSDANGTRASTLQAAQKTNADGTVSSHSSETNAASVDTLGYSQDAHHITVTGANITHSFPVAGEDVAVSGKFGHLTFSGQTHGLSVTGNDNQIEVDNATLIEVTGDRNHIHYSGARPTVKISGAQSSVDPR